MYVANTRKVETTFFGLSGTLDCVWLFGITAVLQDGHEQSNCHEEQWTCVTASKGDALAGSLSCVPTGRILHRHIQTDNSVHRPPWTKTQLDGYAEIAQHREKLLEDRSKHACDRDRIRRTPGPKAKRKPTLQTWRD